MRILLAIMCSTGVAGLGGEQAHGMDVLSSAAASLAEGAPAAKASPKQDQWSRKRSAGAVRQPSDNRIAKSRYADC